MSARRAPAAADPLAQRRRAVHAACRAHGLNEDARRDLQVGVTGKASMTDMDAGDLDRLLDKLNGGARVAAHRPHVGKVRALWWTLYWLGATERPDAPALDAFVRRQTGVDALRFLDHRQAFAVIEALKNWAEREGVAWSPRPAELDDRRAVLAAIERKIVASGGIPPAIGARSLVWTRDEYDAAIRAAGKVLRARGNRS